MPIHSSLTTSEKLQPGGTRLAPFWRYYGGKYRVALRYPAPLHRTIIEPFAGAAGYATRYAERDVILVEKNPVIAELWRWLIASSAYDVRQVPAVEHVDDLPAWVPQGARWLVGFSLSDAVTSPRKSLSAGRKARAAAGRRFEGWCAARRDRIAAQVDRIRHWRILEGDYTTAPDVVATWFVDPPYQQAGAHYPHRLAAGDYGTLADWCRLRRGQVLVCENVGAAWLPFKPFLDAKAGPRDHVSREALWTHTSEGD